MSQVWFDVLHHDPLIGVSASGEGLVNSIAHASGLKPDKPVYLFVQMFWAARPHLAGLVQAQQAIRQSAPNVQMTVMAASPQDQALFQQNGLTSICSNHNAFLDERIFYPEPGALKKYSAVYNGRFSRMKRHELAAKVDNLALLSALYDVSREDIARVHAACPGIAFANLSADGEGRMLSPAEVRGVLCASKCGLALSRVEGAMYASAEYLLCGLPVVSTPSDGGRHMFFHPDYVAIAQDTPESVAAAVARFADDRPDPFLIRARTLALMRGHRHNFTVALSRILQSDLTRLADPNGWMPMFTHRLRGPKQFQTNRFFAG